jgi:hypothetical protein
MATDGGYYSVGGLMEKVIEMIKEFNKLVCPLRWGHKPSPNYLTFLTINTMYSYMLKEDYDGALIFCKRARILLTGSRVKVLDEVLNMVSEAEQFCTSGKRLNQFMKGDISIGDLTERDVRE